MLDVISDWSLVALEADDDGVVRLEEGEEGGHRDVGVLLAAARQEAARLRQAGPRQDAVHGAEASALQGGGDSVLR